MMLEKKITRIYREGNQPSRGSWLDEANEMQEDFNPENFSRISKMKSHS